MRSRLTGTGRRHGTTTTTTTTTINTTTTSTTSSVPHSVSSVPLVMPPVLAQTENNVHSHEEHDDGHQFTHIPLLEDESHHSIRDTLDGRDDSHQSTSVTVGGDSHQSTSVTVEGGGDDSHQSTSVTVEGDDSHQSTRVTVEGGEEASHQSTSIVRDGNDSSHQFTSVSSECNDDGYLSSSGAREGEDDSLSAIVERGGKDDVHQSGSRLCPASPEPPLLPLDLPSARDRGYAWVIVWVVFCVNTLVAGYVKSFGIMYLLLLQYFPDASGAEAGWIMGLLFGTRGILSPFMGALTVKLGARKCCLLGTGFIILGLLLAIPSFSIYYMAITLGGLVGLGLSMSETPGYLLVNDYFLERRLTANGFRASGNPMGGMLFPPLLVFLSEQFGLQGSFIMLAGIMMHLAVLATLMRPFEQHQRMIHHQHMMATQKRSSTTTTTTNGSVVAHTHKDKHPSKKALDFTLFKNPQYLIFLGVALSVNTALPNFLVYLSAYANVVGLTEYQISMIASYFSGIDFVFRILCGYIADKLNLNGSHIFPVGLVVGGVGCLLVPLCSTAWQMMLTSTLFAFGMATFWALLNTLLADQFGAEMTASTWGFFRMVQGIASFLYPSLLGLIKDVTGGYVAPFVVMGSGFIMGSGIFLLQPLVAKLSKRSK